MRQRMTTSQRKRATSKHKQTDWSFRCDCILMEVILNGRRSLTSRHLTSRSSPDLVPAGSTLLCRGSRLGFGRLAEFNSLLTSAVARTISYEPPQYFTFSGPYYSMRRQGSYIPIGLLSAASNTQLDSPLQRSMQNGHRPSKTTSARPSTSANTTRSTRIRTR